MAPHTGHAGVTSVNLISTAASVCQDGAKKKCASAEDIMRALELEEASAAQARSTAQAPREQALSDRIAGKLSEHEAVYGDKALPRGRLPRVDGALLDRYQAARRNVLLLGAIQQAAGTPAPLPQGTAAVQRSRPAAGAEAAVVCDAEGAPEDPDMAAADGTCAADAFLGSRTTSLAFSPCMTRESSAALPLGGLSREPSGCGQLAGEVSLLSCSSRHTLQHHCSGRSATSSGALSNLLPGGLLGLGLKRAGSNGGMGGSESGRTSTYSHSVHGGSSICSRYSRRNPGRARTNKPRPGRITLALLEHARRDDWMSRTLLKHFLASVIQAHWRGYCVRKRWNSSEASREQLVQELHDSLAAPITQARRLHEMKALLAARQQRLLERAAAAGAEPEDIHDGSTEQPLAIGALMSREDLVPLGASTSMLASLPIGRPGMNAGGVDWRRNGLGSPLRRRGAAAVDDGSDSGWSEVELEDVAAVKFRAVTPPWQRHREGDGISRELRVRLAAAVAELSGTAAAQPVGIDNAAQPWEGAPGSEQAVRLEELRERRIRRPPEPVILPLASTRAAADDEAGSDSTAQVSGTTVLSSGVTEHEAHGDAGVSSPLLTAQVEVALLQRYATRYHRLGLPERMPGRTRWLRLQQEVGAPALQ